ncbi:hypothetical protein F7725_028239 [Dissostichus mawsoni]|uniref:Calcium load-activated calcium channel n=1 Tax=Dissostichus mawsoni TaxID=36200 RepID=A0A7J5XFF3_DISMA|nr:hypothetical protein F7725_028239 [Dissostichus mawsoni]
MSTMFADTILIVFISVCTALLAEGITWVLVYRTEKYKRLKAEVEKQSKKLEKKKETITESAGRQQKKKIERQEEKLKNNNRDLSMVRMKSMFAIGFCFTALMGMFNSIFDGRVVAKLPFTPLSYIQGLSHRNLLGEDYTDCSFIFLYILCTMSIRQNIQKMLGLAPSRAATKQAGGFLGPPHKQPSSPNHQTGLTVLLLQTRLPPQITEHKTNGFSVAATVSLPSVGFLIHVLFI